MAPAAPVPEFPTLSPERIAPATAPAPSSMPATERILAFAIWSQPRQVAAGDVAGLVGDDADDLVRRLRLHERAEVQEDLTPFATKALNDRSLMRMISIALASIPAARKIGAA